MSLIMTLGKRIKEARLQKNYTQKDLAKLLNVKSTTVSGWELERNEPSLETLKKMSNILGISFDYLARVNQNSGNVEHIDLKEEPKVISYGGKPISKEDMEIIKAILERHLNGGDK